jgi:ApbE superfamily uncharacterized protein (UPF0280 family)
VKVTEPFYKVISPGQVLVEYGPVCMTIEATADDDPATEAAVAGAHKAFSLLHELSEHLESARRPVTERDIRCMGNYPEVLRRMYSAVRRLGESDFTPMAAVAGTFSDMVKEAVVLTGVDRVIVNNGGDIAFCLGPNSGPLRLGLISDLNQGVVSHTIQLGPQSRLGGVEGVATSGLGGRSLTKGVASAVTCFAKRCSLADAAATSVANATDCDDPAVERCMAEALDTFTDLRGQVVTRRAGPLTPMSVEAALDRGFNRSRDLFEAGIILGAIIFLQGRMKIWPANLLPAVQNLGVSR